MLFKLPAMVFISITDNAVVLAHEFSSKAKFTMNLSSVPKCKLRPGQFTTEFELLFRRLGNPFDLNIQQGPQVDEDQLNTILRYINIGKKEGAKLVTGESISGKINIFRRKSVW